MASGPIFLALASAHAARVLTEGAAPLREPVFMVTTVLSLVMAGCAFRLLRR